MSELTILVFSFFILLVISLLGKDIKIQMINWINVFSCLSLIIFYLATNNKMPLLNDLGLLILIISGVIPFLYEFLLKNKEVDNQ